MLADSLYNELKRYPDLHSFALSSRQVAARSWETSH